MRSQLDNRIVGIGILHDNYDEEAYGVRTKVSRYNLGCSLPNENPRRWIEMSGKCETVVPARTV